MYLTSLQDVIRTLFIITFFRTINSATIGDGKRSLYTGRPIDVTDGRGSCLADGIQYPSETAVPRAHPCHYCICFQSRISCYWKQCSGPPLGCEVMYFENVCNPSLYVCDIPEKTRKEPVVFGARLNKFGFRNRRRRRRRFKRNVEAEHAGGLPVEEGFPVEFKKAWESYVNMKLSRKKRSIDKITALENIIGDTSCYILGVKYFLGEVIGVASDACMECRCAAGRMFCSPKCCFQPSPFSLSLEDEERFTLRARAKGDELRSNPLYYIRNQIDY